MKKNELETLLLTKLVEAVSFDALLQSVTKAIDVYTEDPSEENKGYIVYIMQSVMMKHIMEDRNMTSDQLTKDIYKHSEIMDLFNTSGN